MRGSLEFLLGWFTLYLLLQGGDVFIIRSANDQCLEASLGSSLVLAKKCNPSTHLQDWMWRQDRLYNQGAKRCLSVNETFIVQTAACENGSNLMWTCRNRLLIHINTTRFLTSDGGAVLISKEKSKKSKWRSTNNTSICEKQLQDNPQVTSATVKKPHERIGAESQNKTQEERTTLEQKLPYPTEDSTNWNYAILTLAFVTLFLAFLILVLSHRANKRRKLNEARDKNETDTDSIKKAIQYGVEVDNITETDHITEMLQTKQAFVPLNAVAQTPTPKMSPKPGQILVEWKDGNISSLFMDGKEDDV
ncbi:solute carrier family 51 subunit beta [Hypanus sabinus]|uniref:solute carrier family 51 subunit beta n=1 Tax=Hypanus sabinus TaxID=79690 RepID=UPI0028C418E5|nr:solute carrier family 51 subunit beta [Hypanus sabinus]XP_059808812.1 solute carrier family 51 subunit beta [Hypanus sabinus]XP_059808813.1 solute carrier family 51 subunit beta [Hypanus sabinus]